MSEFLNEKILYSGFIENWVEKEETINLLLSKVKVKGYKQEKYFLEDHFWVKIPKEQKGLFKNYQRLEILTGIGLVKKYERKNGKIGRAHV